MTGIFDTELRTPIYLIYVYRIVDEDCGFKTIRSTAIPDDEELKSLLLSRHNDPLPHQPRPLMADVTDENGGVVRQARVKSPDLAEIVTPPSAEQRNTIKRVEQ